MKTKKLWALLVAAVMVIGLLPVSAFAAIVNVYGAPPALGFQLGNTSWSFSNADFKTNGTTASTTVTVTKTVNISYDDVATGALLLRVTGATGTNTVAVNTDSAGFGVTANTNLKGPYSGLIEYNLEFESKALGTTNNNLKFTQSGLDWDIDNDQAVTANIQTVVYDVTFNITAPSTYTVSIAPGSRASGVTVKATNADLGNYNGTSNVSVTVPKETVVEFVAPSGKNPGNNTYVFSYWQFDKQVTIDTASGNNKAGTLLSSLITTDSSTAATNAAKFKVPVGGFTATAYDTSGAAWGSSTGTGGGSATPGTPGTYRLTTSGGAIVRVGSNYSYTPRTYDDIYSGTQVILRGDSYASGCYWNVGGNRFDGQEVAINMPSATTQATFYTSGTYTLSTGSSSGGYATVSSDGTNRYKVTASPYSGYYFSSWSLDSNTSYVLGYGSTSNPTYVTVSGNATITPSFIYGDYYYPGTYYPGGTGMPGGYYPGGTYYPSGTTTLPGNANTSNSNTFGTGTAQASVTSTGVVAGYNSSGSINSTNTVNAVTRYFRNYPNATALNLNIPTGATAMSASTARKIITAAGTRTVTLVNSASFGSISYDLSAARNYYFNMSSNSSRYSSARNTIVRAYGNSDTRGFSLSVNNLGASATFRIKVSQLGVSAGAGDTVYALFYNPSTNGFTRKTLVVNSAGEVAYATTRGGVHLFSETPFAK